MRKVTERWTARGPMKHEGPLGKDDQEPGNVHPNISSCNPMKIHPPAWREESCCLRRVKGGLKKRFGDGELSSSSETNNI